MKKIKLRYLHKDKSGVKWYALKEDYFFTCANKEFVIPAGFVTNLASIPKNLQFMFKPNNKKYLMASVCHDFLYELNNISRLECDKCYFSLMESNGANLITRLLFFIGVRLFGSDYKS